MRRRGARLTLVAAAALLLAAGPPPGLESTRALIQRLKRAGHVSVTYRASIRGEEVRVRRGTLTLEPPDRVRLDESEGERIALRADGGEWLQPATRQMITLRAEQVASAMGLWRLFLDPARGLYAERPLGRSRFRLGLATPTAELPESVTVTLSGSGLPSRIEFVDPAGDLASYEFGAWRFGPARGAASFRLAAPPGFEVIEMP